VLLLVGLVALSRAPRGPVDQAAPGPVLMVPGYGNGRSGLEVLAAHLRASGRDVTVLTMPGRGTGDLRRSARVLDEAADAALDDGAASVDVVGYSAGGVVARYWAAELGGADVARRVVTLGAPHHGTRIARAGPLFGDCPAGCRQLATGSELLADLNREDETPDGPVWTTVWTDQDTVVVPPDSSRLDGAVEVVVQSVCPGAVLDHGTLSTAPLVQALVRQALGPGPAPTGYDCASLTS
jgi:pimeloyl-ACP methyl ester carboxylesterase